MIRAALERLLFACRFLLAPIYLVLAISLIALFGRSALHLFQLLMHFQSMDDETVLLTELTIVDLTLTASLVVIVFLSGYANFIAPVVMREGDGRPHWMTEIDFGDLKLKLMASIVAISAIKLLEGYMNISHASDRELAWMTGIHLAFVASALLLAVTERISQRPRANDPKGG